MAMSKASSPQNSALLLHLLLQQDFTAFARKAWMSISGGEPIAWNWHIEAIIHDLGLVMHGKCRRLLVTMPPRNGKSKLISIIFVAWCLGQDPRKSFVCVSYSGELAGEFARDCLSIIQSGWYRDLFPRTVISPKRSAAHDFKTTAGGGRLATSVSGTLTGRGGDIIILDDVIKPDEAFSETVREKVNDWYRKTLVSRLDDKRKGAIICVMQRLHQFDLAGLMIESGQWRQLKLAAIATDKQKIALPGGRFHFREVGDVLHAEREPLDILEAQRIDMGSSGFAAQYQQEPVPAEGLIFKSRWLKYYEPSTLVFRDAGGVILQSWDTGNKIGESNAWSVCITALYRNGLIYILDVCRIRLEMPDLVKKAIELALHYRPQHLFIEDKASGEALIQFLRKELPTHLWPTPRNPTTDKVTRAEGVSPIVENGRLFLPTESAWLGEFKAELLGFPNVRYLDQVDAFSQMLEWVRQQDAAMPIPLNEGPQLMDEYGSQDSDYDDDPWGIILT